MAHAKRLAAILPLLLALLMVSGSALAQTVTITQTTRDDIDPGRDPLSINRSDCLNNGIVEVTVRVQNQEDYQLEVWGGTGTCTDDETRNQLNSVTCWKIFSDEARNMSIPLHVQDIVQPPADDGTDRCSQGSGSFTVWFLLVSGTVNKTANPATLVFKFDLSGPSAPRLRSVNPGESSLILRWEGSNSNDVNGYRIYCQEAEDTEATGTSGTGGTSSTPENGGATSGGTESNGGTGGVEAGGSDTGAQASGNGGSAGTSASAGTAGSAAPDDNGCRGARLRAGEVPPEDLRRGSASQASVEGAAKNLVNNRTYACGVAAYDDDDNVGPLSNMLCERPRPVIDYFEAYRRAGGTAGGGYCSFGRASATETLGALFGFGALALALRRRSRRSVP